MAYRKFVLGLSGCLFVVICVLLVQADVMSMISSSGNNSGRADLIMIQTMAKQTTKQAQAVPFLHDLHTEALAEQDKDCTACHIRNDQDVISFKYMRLEDPPAEQLKNLYHQNCTSCHAGNAAAGMRNPGPQIGECRKCHAEPTSAQEWVSGGMDNMLHYIHWSSDLIPKDEGEETNCGQCHHDYDPDKEELVYTRFTEEGCRSCHTSEPQEPVKSNLAEAFHGQCVTCHLDQREANAERNGPLDCASCHGTAQSLEMRTKNQQRLAEMDGVMPRLPRNQPDAVLLTAKMPENTNGTRPTLMYPVAFNHELHEHQTDACGSCHHETLKSSCTDCHTLQGTEQGGYITLEKAMHSAQSTYSCVGCHNELKNDPSCAGCHAAMPRGTEPPAASCAVCHVNPDTTNRNNNEAAQDYSDYTEMLIPAQPNGRMPPREPFVLPEDKEGRAVLAQQIIDRRPSKPLLISVEDIPDVVIIDVLADEYQPAELPHRKIILSMMEKMEDNSLATVFHETPVTMCQGCHHHSPLSATPPSCQTCHDQRSPIGRVGRPGLLAAYHIQCMACHQEMELEKPVATDCYSCHKQKDNG
ncbi:Cytochrome c7 [Desulfonatronum thiosulfatophilum]|uniref:Cytochrome c7 n=1 Tax=Desulfonatronum thiosulfatophilum TaxID=617002 RepID=A0A1G6CX50_9BACT|nr:cytochrome c3 family protein [Desulfonatronum thiosulfatophilum]SDB37408.1 Cytochrome c7 [Desulfonatronum thiosulfatophilum]